METHWKQRFMRRAFEIAKWSKDPSTQVGACVTSEKRVISEGFNGFPPGIQDLAGRYLDRDIKLKMVLHAEQNALWFANGDTEGRYLFCTHYPCPRCASEIVRANIKRVIVPKSEIDFDRRWDADLTQEMFSEAGIVWEIFNDF